MAKKSKEITVKFCVGGEIVEKLSPELLQKMSQRLSEGMSEYYTAHPEEYKVLCNCKK